MSNEREAFEAWSPVTTELLPNGKDYISPTARLCWETFQAGAAYQREQDKKLVEALENLCSCIMETRGPNADKALFDAREALAAYRAQQDKPHD